ncbi:COG1238 Predicted membrane protein [Candidatus Pelagibacterales bacterium]|jgi:membrane protein YqaA with SNARE-associated domain
MRSLYNKILALCLKKQSEKVLYFISFIESSVFPIPIVFLMIPVQLVKRHRAMIIGFLVTVSSVLGGALGYYLGYFFYDTIGAKVISLYGYQDSFLEFTNSISKEMEFWFVFFYAFTPFPYKLLTIGSGFVQFNFWIFIIGSFISRAIRFLTISFLIWKFGESIKNFIDKYLNILTLITALLLILIFIFVKYYF